MPSSNGEIAAKAAVLFDMDGVIIDSRRFHLDAWHELAREHSIGHVPDYFTSTFGLRNGPIISGIVPGIDVVRLAELAERKETLFREAARGNLETLPGVRELLDFLSEQGIPKAVVTSAPRANLDMIIETLGLARWFEALVAEEDATKGKPDPEGFLVAAALVGVAPTSCTVIEDAPAGLQAAKAGAMRALGVTTTHPSAELGDADLVVDSLTDERVRAFILAP